MSFFNTIGFRGKKLKKATEKAKSQTELVLEFFKKNNKGYYTPVEVHKALFTSETPLTSVRRAMSDLTSKGKINQTARQKQGAFGKLNYCWTYKF